MDNTGHIFKAAREKKKATLSQAAAATRVKVQHLEAMERDDYSRMPAPAYAKGFIRMYADYLGLDPVPLVRAYVENHLGALKPPVDKEVLPKVLSRRPAPAAEAVVASDPAPAGEAAAPVAPAADALPEEVPPALLERLLGGLPVKRALLILAAVALIVLGVFALSHRTSPPPAREPAAASPVKAPAPAPAPPSPLGLIREPVEPFILFPGMSNAP